MNYSRVTVVFANGLWWTGLSSNVHFEYHYEPGSWVDFLKKPHESETFITAEIHDGSDVKISGRVKLLTFDSEPFTEKYIGYERDTVE